MEADGIDGGRKGGYTLNEPKDTRSPRFGRLNERRRAESAMIDRGKKHPKHTRRHYITTVRQPEQKRAEAAVIDFKKTYIAHQNKNIFHHDLVASTL